jgi:hypothetical protein
MVTHLDDPIKFRMLREALSEVADVAICMSKMTMHEVARIGVAQDALCYVTPPGDGGIPPRRTVIGITSRAYPDGRKREYLLSEVARSVPLDLFHFEIIGKGWDKLIPELEAAGATVLYYPETDDFQRDHAYIKERLKTFDYYLYLGLDEGSMGLLDALAAGVDTIVTRQGFHLDIENGITHGFVEGRELIAIFQQLRERRERLRRAVGHLTWEDYARQHALVWRCLAEGRRGEIATSLHGHSEQPPSLPHVPQFANAKSRLQFYLKAGRSDFRKIYLDRRKWQVRAALSRIKRRLLGVVR